MTYFTETHVHSQDSSPSHSTFKVHFSPLSSPAEFSSACDRRRLRSPPPQYTSSVEKLFRILSSEAKLNKVLSRKCVRKDNIQFVSGERIPCDWVQLPNFPAPYEYTMLSLAEAQADHCVSHRHFLA